MESPGGPGEPEAERSGRGVRATRRLVRRIFPGLLRRAEVARARSFYLREPARGPECVLLEATTACNHRCVMCPDHSPRLEGPLRGAHMPLDRVRSLLEELAGMGTQQVWLAGRGEPLLHPAAEEILRAIGSLGLRSSITTNASRLTEELAEELCDSGLEQLSISIDSGTPETYARVHGARPEERERLLGLVRRLSRRAERRPRLLVSMVLLKWNLGELLDFVRDGVEHGADAVVVSAMQPTPFDSFDLALKEADWRRVRADLAEAEQVTRAAGAALQTSGVPPPPGTAKGEWPYAEMACFIGHFFSAVHVDGSVHGCCACRNDLGSVEETSFAEVWRSPSYRTFRRACRELPVTGLVPPGCGCREGCGRAAYNASVQQRLRLRFRPQLGGGEFASRPDLAAAVWQAVRGMLPEGDGDAGEGGDAVGRVARLWRRGGKAADVPGWLAQPLRMVPRRLFSEVMAEALALAGIPQEQAEALVAAARVGSGRPLDPLTKRELTQWASRARGEVDRQRG